MTRVIIYSSALVAVVAATAMTLTAILIPNWISIHMASDLTLTYGLHRSCSSITQIPGSTSGLLECKPFPELEDCKGADGYFCGLWRTIGFLMNFAAVLNMVIIVGFMVVLHGGKQKRENGWKVIVGMLTAVAFVQCAAMSIVAFLFDNDERFFDGWYLDKSWILCTVSWSVSMLSAVFVALSAFIFPNEAGYELIPSERHNG